MGFRTDKPAVEQEIQVSRENNPSFFLSLRFRYGLGLLFFLVVAGFFLWKEHAAHILGALPLLLLLGACVGMHAFMHGGHGHGGKPRTPRDG